MSNTDEDQDAQEQKLLRRARGGDRKAMGQLVRVHEGTIYRFLLARTRDEDRAADLAQETFVKALRSLDSFRGDSSFLTWLLAIARNEFRGAYRRRNRRREQSLETAAEVPDDRVDPEGAAMLDSEVVRVRYHLERLPEKQRMSVALRIFDGLSFREVGEATGSSEGAARVNFHHGVRRLREWLDHDE